MQYILVTNSKNAKQPQNQVQPGYRLLNNQLKIKKNHQLINHLSESGTRPKKHIRQIHKKTVNIKKLKCETVGGLY